MSAAAKLAGFAAAMAVVFGGAALAGGATDADPPRKQAEAAHQPAESHTVASSSDPHSSSPEQRGAAGETHPVRGLAVVDDGLRLVVDDPELRLGADETVRFRILGQGGAGVDDFDLEHDKRMHVIVVRRDTQGFQHLHPRIRADGTWELPLTLGEPGSYRLFADFARDGENVTLATDLRVDGRADLADLPPAVDVTTTDTGYEVRLDAGAATAGKAGELRFAISKGGQAVHTEPYLGAGGHLVALREGDLAFLHVHPSDHADGEDEAGHDDSVGFEATFPTPGRYRLFLQFQHEGRVHTAAFTQEVK